MIFGFPVQPFNFCGILVGVSVRVFSCVLSSQQYLSINNSIVYLVSL
jgi:hypothetical protein